jgi:mannose-1-phosphate guanylyltransferase/mannose-1-phosphate guanylyltransferase/phosphomannomutase
MKAMILAAGGGTRLHPLTHALPKPMLPVANLPVMEYVVRLLARHGCDEIIVNLHHLGHTVSDHFGDGRRFGVRVAYSHEEEPVGTAGGVKRVAEFFAGQPFVVIGGDDLTDIDLGALVDFHRHHGALATIALTEVPDVSRFGVVVVEENGRIARFQEKPPPEQALSNLANTGVYVFQPEILEFIPPGEFHDFGHQVFPLLLERGAAFYGYRAGGYWRDVGTPGEYLEANWDVLHGGLAAELTRGRPNRVRRGRTCVIARGVVFQPPALLGDAVEIGRGARIGPLTCIGSGAHIGAGAVVEKSVVWPGTHVGEGVVLESTIAAPHCTLKP